MPKTAKIVIIVALVGFLVAMGSIIVFTPNHRDGVKRSMIKSREFEFSNNSWDIGYVIEIDSIEYVVIKARDGVAITRHRDLHVMQK